MKKIKKEIFNIIEMFISLLISAIVFNLFIKKINIATGGVNGIAIIINEIWNIDYSMTIFVVLGLLMILSIIFLGIKRTTGSIISVFLYPFLVKITSSISSLLIIKECHYMIFSIYIGLISGFANALMYKTEYNNGGLPIINQILYKYKRIPIDLSSFVLNSIIVVIGAFFLGFVKMLYAILILYINSKVIKSILAIDRKKISNIVGKY